MSKKKYINVGPERLVEILSFMDPGEKWEVELLSFVDKEVYRVWYPSHINMDSFYDWDYYKEEE